VESILPCYLPYRKAAGLQILCCQGIKVTDYDFTLDALALKPSDFCDAVDWQAQLVTHIPNKGEQMACYYG
jgi:hypothetical protein